TDGGAGGAASTNPKARKAMSAVAARSIGPVTVKVHCASVGGFFVRADIHHLNNSLPAVSLVPHRHIGRPAFLEMTVMACTGELAIIGPIARVRGPALQAQAGASVEGPARVGGGLGRPWPLRDAASQSMA